MSTKRPSRLERSSKPEPKTVKPKAKRKKKLTAKKVLWTSFFTIAFAIFCALAGYLYITINGEKILAENEGKLTIYETSKVYDRHGNLMGELSLEKSEPVTSEEIPKLLKDAFIATEDKRFYEHNGVDLWAIGRAAVKDIVARKLVEGGSTITQQLAKNIFLDFEKTFFRKATEVSIAMALERDKTKDEIITMYLNRINFGGTVYGIKAASIRYFGKSDLNDLEVWEMATLAAMPKAPSRYNPLRNPDLSMQRRAVVLQLMYEQGYITQAEMEHAKAVVYDYEPPARNQSFEAFKDYVLEEAERKWGITEDQLNRGGYKIYTTMDMKAQKALEKAFANDDFFEKSKDDQQVQASMVIMNHQNGSLVALLGGRDYQRKGFSRLDSRRQPGSVFKPIVSFAPALDTGKFTPDSMVSNEKQCFGNYCPNNLGGSYSKTISFKTALTKSINIPAVWLLNEVGVGTGVKYATEMGITMDKDDRNLAIALGGMTYGTNTLEMATAFSVFANQGRYNEPYSIKSIVDHSGKEVHKADAPKQKQVLKEQTAYQMTQLLQDVVNEGTGKRARINRPVAGKTGTTQHGIKNLRSSKNRDVWFVGYTPEWTGAVWMGYDKVDKDHLLNGSSGQTAALFAAVMKEALEDVPVKDFPVPKNMPQAEPPVVDELSAPSELTALYSEETQTVSLNWNGVDQEGAVYRIYRKEASESEYTYYLDSATTSIEDLTVVTGTSYEYYVTAYDPVNDIESGASNKVVTDTVVEEEPMDDIDPDQDGLIPPDQGQEGIDPGQGLDGDGQDGPEQGNGYGNGSGNGQGNGPGNGSSNGNGNGNSNGNSNSNGPGNSSGNGSGVPPGQGGAGDGSVNSGELDGSGTVEPGSGDAVTPPLGESDMVDPFANPSDGMNSGG
ncbi:transglycosylase domain-containing protein [Paenibacillus lentus]|uniref:PBP1A family penicillin-binding protein n=1 Tax=Paenibacillus lentus TaxID=1338368 RepID=A0A3S8RWG3_9BACL|nr:PBP1A family penicillin-binding protein [Paenibacillus lentus]AZK47356.1 PBP1A family penicillin-binding protein [Paenibacillus lentus]